MYGIALLLVVALVSLLITRVAAIALTATGMPVTSARFQARSALSGVGFTTSEAETVVNHPARRRIIMGLMLAGNVGLVTAMAGLLGGFVNSSGVGGGLSRVALLIGGLAVVYLISQSPRVDRALSRAIGGWLERHTDLDVRDYAALLHVSGDYAIKEIPVGAESWLTQRPLGELRLRDEGVIVLGIVHHDGSYDGVPDKETRVRADDTLIVYGETDTVASVASRRQGRAGDLDHDQHRLENDT